MPAVHEGRFGPCWAKEDFVAAGGELEDSSAYVGGEAEEGRERLVADGAGERLVSALLGARGRAYMYLGPYSMMSGGESVNLRARCSR